MSSIVERISHFRQYINELNDFVTVNDSPNAITTISKFKKIVMKQDPTQHANQFLIDCLRTKHEKLLSQLEELKQEKKNLQNKINEKKTNCQSIKESQVRLFMTRLTIGINDIKKIEYDEVTIGCDYLELNIQSKLNHKYPLKIQVSTLQIIQDKQTYLHLIYQKDVKYNLIIKFIEEKELNRWVTCLRLAKMIHHSKNHTKLFQPKPQQEENNIPSPKQSSILPTSNHPGIIPSSNFKPSPSENISVIEQKKDKSVIDRSFNDKLEKNTQRSLVNAMSHNRLKKPSREKDDKSVREESFGNKSSNPKEGHSGHLYKYEQNRPPNLNRIRGRSENIENNNFEVSKFYKAGKGGRKNSQDTWKSQINQAYNRKMLEKLKMREISQDGRSDSMKSKRESKTPDSVENKPLSHQKDDNTRQKLLEQRKKSFLNSHSLAVGNHNFKTDKAETPGFAFDIEEMEDENKSKSSKYSKQGKRRNSIFGESVKSEIDEQQQKNIKESGHITEKSEQQSPKFPKTENKIQFPTQITYSNGTTFRLHPVQKTQPEIEKSVEQIENIHQPEEEKQNLQSSSSESHNHSDESSHEDNTESQDNALRAQDLKKPIILTKCSENGFWSHEKSVYISEDEQNLCIRDISDKKIKKIKISSITKVDLGKFDKGIIRHISKIQDNKCLVIRADMDDSKNKNFQFYGNNPQALQTFANNLIQFIQYSRKS